MNLCRDCAHLVGVRSRQDLAPEWKCGHESIQRQQDPVSGQILYLSTCYQARTLEGVCKPEGILFKLYEQPAYPPSTARGKPSLSADSLLGELGL